jgi:alkylation response protein AidB-like acyl-CoA dehydrogenase
MDLLLKEEHHQVRETARKFADEVVRRARAKLDEKEEFPTEIVARWQTSASVGHPFPEKYGGAGARHLAYVIASRRSPAHAAPQRSPSPRTFAGLRPVYENGTEEQSRSSWCRWLRARAIGAFGLTESAPGRMPPARRRRPSARTACGA